MLNEVFKNYDVFYNMVLSTTIMSNSPTDELLTDARSIIRFIGKSYKLDDSLIAECEAVILDELVTLGLTTDQQAVYSSRSYGDKYSERDALFDIKGDVLTKLQNLTHLEAAELNSGWFDYSHYKTYQANVRFAKIYKVAATGNIIATRQIGILTALGIGCNVDLREAENRLFQCVCWGDIPSMFMLSHIYSLSGNAADADLFSELAQLSKKYLLAGYTVLPDEVKMQYSEKARVYFAYVATIKQDIVYAYNKSNIDFSFVEAICLDSLDYFERMSYINNYDKKQWKNLTNSATKPIGKIGFSQGGSI